MRELPEYRQKRADLLGKADAILAKVAGEKRSDMTADESKSFDGYLAEIKTLDAGVAASPGAPTLVAQSKRDLESQLRIIGYSKGASEKIAAGGWNALAKPKVDEPETALAAIKEATDAFRSAFVVGASYTSLSLKGLKEKRADIAGGAEDQKRLPTASERAELAKLDALIEAQTRIQESKAALAVPV